MPVVSVLIADNHALLRQGVMRVLGKNCLFKVVSEVESGTGMLEEVISKQPDLILTDIGMPGISVFDVISQVKKKLPRTKIAFLTEHDDERYVSRAVAFKASYILKDTPPGQLMAALQQIAQGTAYLSPEIRTMVENVQSLRQKLSEHSPDILTRREREILKLLAEGLAAKEIALNLELSLKTIEAHKFNLMRKLDIHNKIELVRYSIREGIIACPGQGRCYHGQHESLLQNTPVLFSKGCTCAA